jgi:hypothetical protein
MTGSSCAATCRLLAGRPDVMELLGLGVESAETVTLHAKLPVGRTKKTREAAASYTAFGWRGRMKR